MPRKPKPYLRKQTNTWYFSTGGRKYNLGKDKDEAFRKFHQMMADPTFAEQSNDTLYELTQAYLDWVKDNRKPVTYDKHLHYLKSFIEHVGKRMKPSSLKNHHVTKWVQKDTRGSTSRNDAITIVKRMLNWRIDQGYFASNPIAGIRKPKAKRREIVYTQEQWAAIKEHAQGPLALFLDFLYSTGCRPKEARTLEARHVHGDLVILPPDESKGEADSRVIFLTEESKKIIDPLIAQHQTGPIFLNARGKPWTKDSIKGRLKRISEKVSFRVVAYGMRRTYCTNALINNVDTVSLAHLLGHKGTRMIDNYAHVPSNVKHLQEQANKGRGMAKAQTDSLRP